MLFKNSPPPSLIRKGWRAPAFGLFFDAAIAAAFSLLLSYTGVTFLSHSQRFMTDVFMGTNI